MIGNTAIYLAREIGSWNLINLDQTKQIETITNNEVTIRAFKNAIDDMAVMMYKFMSSDRRSNMYGYKMKFYAIESIVSQLHTCLTSHSNVAFGCCNKDYNKIADDLEFMAETLNFEIENNMIDIESSDKNYKVMPNEVTV